MNLKKHLATVLWLGLALVASAMAAPNTPNTGPAWKPRDITVGMKSAAIRSITS